jgi:hypothetical protein
MSIIWRNNRVNCLFEILTLLFWLNMCTLLFSNSWELIYFIFFYFVILVSSSLVHFQLLHDFIHPFEAEISPSGSLNILTLVLFIVGWNNLIQFRHFMQLLILKSCINYPLQLGSILRVYWFLKLFFPNFLYFGVDRNCPKMGWNQPCALLDQCTNRI